MALPDPLPVEPLAAPPDADVVVPGSKSITNRALVCAALAGGRSVLTGALVADDTEAMAAGLSALGARVALDRTAATMTVEPAGTAARGRAGDGHTVVDARQSGTTARFLLPTAALGAHPVTVTGHRQLAERPMADGIAALRTLGAVVEGDGLPVTVTGPVEGGEVALAGDVSSQFLSGLMLAGPAMAAGLTVHLTTPLVSRPYVDMTAAVMGAFGATVEVGPDTVTVAPTGYRSVDGYPVEPDASAAGYFWAAAAVAGGRVRVLGLDGTSLQGDVAFTDVLAAMGAEVGDTSAGRQVTAGSSLVAADADLGAISDAAPTFAVVAARAAGTSRARGIGFIRRKESDRIGATVAELVRCGVDASEDPDGFTVVGGGAHGATVETYDDHRLAMAFAVLGLAVPGVALRHPGCVAKTFPGFFDALGQLR